APPTGTGTEKRPAGPQRVQQMAAATDAHSMLNWQHSERVIRGKQAMSDAKRQDLSGPQRALHRRWF
ncbi:MAG TPA: hypothetical protein VNG91_03450, partial [Terriglobia bacterium]|nr:hypothetical protein [Terriglobia bacterium]